MRAIALTPASMVVGRGAPGDGHGRTVGHALTLPPKEAAPCLRARLDAIPTPPMQEYDERDSEGRLASLAKALRLDIRRVPITPAGPGSPRDEDIAAKLIADAAAPEARGQGGEHPLHPSQEPTRGPGRAQIA
ncbi:hypothetical protein ACQ5SO_02325 [Rhodovulum sp. DZ06]|uniref:hypothetical protein n=1 Tax=Rhodovulum sp. DZ06 TaxID=3425126 RepID=UPI003D350A15